MIVIQCECSFMGVEMVYSKKDKIRSALFYIGFKKTRNISYTWKPGRNKLHCLTQW